MKEVYLIQDMQQPTRIIAFDSRRSFTSYLQNFGFKKDTITRYFDNVTLTGTLYDIVEIDDKHPRKVVVRVITTANYWNGSIELTKYFNELTEGKI